MEVESVTRESLFMHARLQGGIIRDHLHMIVVLMVHTNVLHHTVHFQRHFFKKGVRS